MLFSRTFIDESLSIVSTILFIYFVWVALSDFSLFISLSQKYKHSSNVAFYHIFTHGSNYLNIVAVQIGRLIKLD